MSSAELLSAARDLVRRSQDVEADLLVHLGEIDERRLYLDCVFPSMFAFCVGELSCRAHNQREAEKMYGRSFMESARKVRGSVATRSGTSPPPQPEG
jgi:hypothetical protein